MWSADTCPYSRLEREAVMRVKDVMTVGVKTIAPTAAADDASNIMRFNHIHHLVVTEGRRVVGVLSDRDTGVQRGASVRMNSTVADLMTAPAVTVEQRTTRRTLSHRSPHRQSKGAVAVW
jgi:signal-transduction protein with cAMP-binding, CBS, and nucleotidyltransferase domain